MSVPTMSEEALGFVIETLQYYKEKEVVRVLKDSEYFAAHEMLIKSGLGGFEAESVLMHISKVEDIISGMKKVLGLFKKANKFREDSLKKKELEEAQAFVATKLAEITELEKNKKELEEAQALVARLVAELQVSGP